MEDGRVLEVSCRRLVAVEKLPPQASRPWDHSNELGFEKWVGRPMAKCKSIQRVYKAQVEVTCKENKKKEIKEPSQHAQLHPPP